MIRTASRLELTAPWLTPAIAREVVREYERGIRCECGQLVDGHPPLPPALPLDHGRPCSRPIVLERYGDNVLTRP